MRISDWSSDVCSSDLISLLWGIGLQIAPLLKTGGTSASLLPNAGSHLSDYTPMQSHASRLRAERGGVRFTSRPDPPSVPVLYPVARLIAAAFAGKDKPVSTPLPSGTWQNPRANKGLS